MGYRSETIATTIRRLNNQYFLPAIQREFVWRPDQILQLLDSILRRYPIGSLLFWELEQKNKHRWEIYRFIDHAKQGGTHNALASAAGVQQLNLVLDGQQRLTALLIALKGTYLIKRRYMRWDNPDAWVQHRVFLNLFHDPAGSDEDDGSLRYDLQFLQEAPAISPQHFWYQIGKILDYDSEDRFYAERQAERNRLLQHQVPDANILVFERNLERLYRAIWKDETVSYYTEHDQDYDRVLDIFVRANSGGTTLSKSDLLLSMVTSKWGHIKAREEIFQFVDRLNNDLARKNNFDKDFVLKTCLVLCNLPVQYRVKNFDNQNLDRIRDHWSAIKAAIEKAVNLANAFGLDRDTLTSANALIPICYYFFPLPKATLLGTSEFESTNARRIRTWLLSALLNNVFARATDSVLSDIRKTLKESLVQGDDFPINQLNTVTEKYGQQVYTDEPAIDSFLSIGYGRGNVFLALTLLQGGVRGLGAYHIDHIFPKGQMTPERMTAAGLSDDQQQRFMERVDRIGNLQLLLASENIGKSDQDFATWLAGRGAEFREQHLIPADPELYRFEHFEAFVAAREALIRTRLKTLFADI